jgi:hypothetical protein
MQCQPRRAAGRAHRAAANASGGGHGQRVPGLRQQRAICATHGDIGVERARQPIDFRLQRGQRMVFGRQRCGD